MTPIDRQLGLVLSMRVVYRVTRWSEVVAILGSWIALGYWSYFGGDALLAASLVGIVVLSPLMSYLARYHQIGLVTAQAELDRLVHYRQTLERGAS